METHLQHAGKQRKSFRSLLPTVIRVRRTFKQEVRVGGQRAFLVILQFVVQLFLLIGQVGYVASQCAISLL